MYTNKLTKDIEDFFKNPKSKVLSIPCKNEGDREIITDFVLLAANNLSIEMSQEDHRTMANKEKNKWILLDVSYDSEIVNH